MGERGQMRRRLRERRRAREARLLDLGALVYELHRQGRRAPELLQQKAAELTEIDEEVRELEEALDGPREEGAAHEPEADELEADEPDAHDPEADEPEAHELDAHEPEAHEPATEEVDPVELDAATGDGEHVDGDDELDEEPAFAENEEPRA